MLFLIWVVWPKDLHSDAYIGVFTMAVAASFLTSSANKNRMGEFFFFILEKEYASGRKKASSSVFFQKSDLALM